MFTKKKTLAYFVVLAVLGISIPKIANSQSCCPSGYQILSDPAGMCACSNAPPCYDQQMHDGDCANPYYIKFTFPSTGCNIDSVRIMNEDGACFSACFGVEDPNNSNAVAQWPTWQIVSTCESRASASFYQGGSVPLGASGVCWVQICTTGSSGGWHWKLKLFSGGAVVCNYPFIN
jgi:hypothetical protein